MDDEITYNKNRDVRVDISQCKIGSFISYEHWVSFPEKGRDKKGDKAYLRYADFELIELESVKFERGERHELDEFPRLKLRFGYDVGKLKHHKFKPYASRSSSDIHAKYVFDKKITDKLEIFFNYNGGEDGLISRMKEAFLRLARLAKKNPSCQPNKEVF